MTKRKKEKPEFLMYINTVKFTILKDGSGGIATIEYEKIKEKEDRGFKKIDVKLPVVACWIDEFNGSVIKAHLQSPRRAVREKLSRYMFFQAVRKVGPVDHRDGMSISADSSGILRYGARNIQSHYDHSNSNRAYHDSKGVLIKSILDYVSVSNILVGGITLIDLANIDDEVLEQVGFIKINDSLGHLPAMWAGDISDVFMAGSGYGFKNVRKNMESFLTLIEKSLGKVSVS